jgi:hypothetical protein
MAALLSASENGLTPGGILAEWLMCEIDALTYSCAKNKEFLSQDDGPRNIASNPKC